MVAALVLLSVVFLLIGNGQGPKISEAQFDEAAIVARPDQQLRLFLNQPVQDAASATATVVPAVPASVTSSGEVVSVQFGAPLFYDTEYSVKVDGLRSLDSRASSSVDYSFGTASPSLMYLDRDDDGDSIIRTGLTGSERETVFTAQNIIAFDVVGQALVVATALDSGSSALQLVSLTDGVAEDIRLPTAGVISRLAASDVGSVIGFTLTGAGSTVENPASQVLVMNLDRGRDLIALGDSGDGALPVLDWLFVPNSDSLIVLAAEGVALRFEPERDAVPVPVGRFVSLTGISQDGVTLIGEDSTGITLTDLADGSQRDPEPSVIDGVPPLVAEVALAWNGDVVEKIALQNGDGIFTVALAVDDGTTARAVYVPPGVGDTIDAYRLSPNGQYVGIELVPEGTADAKDSHPTNARPSATTTVIVDLATGASTRSFEGFNLVWLPPGL